MIPSKSSAAHIRIASYNIRKCIGLDRRRNPERTLDVINGLDADIVVLQEADRRLGLRPAAIPTRLLRTQTDLQPVPLATNAVSLGWHGNAILVRAHIHITRAARVDLPSLEPRGAVAADLDLNGRHLRVVGLHLGLTRRHRRRQLAALIAHLDQCAPMPTCIVGDFNEWASSRGLEALGADYTLFSPGKSYHASRPVAALDRIAVNVDCHVLQYAVQRFGRARRASDHLPIWADLALR